MKHVQALWRQLLMNGQFYQFTDALSVSTAIAVMANLL